MTRPKPKCFRWWSQPPGSGHPGKSNCPRDVFRCPARVSFPENPGRSTAPPGPVSKVTTERLSGVKRQLTTRPEPVMRVDAGCVTEVSQKQTVPSLAATDQRLAVREQGQPPHFLTMTAQHVQTLATRDVPDANRLISTAGGQLFPSGQNTKSQSRIYGLPAVRFPCRWRHPIGGCPIRRIQRRMPAFCRPAKMPGR